MVRASERAATVVDAVTWEPEVFVMKIRRTPRSAWRVTEAVPVTWILSGVVVMMSVIVVSVGLPDEAMCRERTKKQCRTDEMDAQKSLISAMERSESGKAKKSVGEARYIL